MMPGGLQLFKVGSNMKVHALDRLIDLTQMRTPEGAVTKVKVMAASESGGSGKEVPSKVLAIEQVIQSSWVHCKTDRGRSGKTAAAAKTGEKQADRHSGDVYDLGPGYQHDSSWRRGHAGRV